MRANQRALIWGALATLGSSSVAAYGTWRVAVVQVDKAQKEEIEDLKRENQLLVYSNQGYRLDQIERRLDQIDAWQIKTTERQDQRQADTNKTLAEISVTLAELSTKISLNNAIRSP